MKKLLEDIQCTHQIKIGQIYYIKYRPDLFYKIIDIPFKDRVDIVECDSFGNCNRLGKVGVPMYWLYDVYILFKDVNDAGL